MESRRLPHDGSPERAVNANASSTPGSTRELTLLQINDLHGYMEPHAEIRWQGDAPVFSTMGGLARVATAFLQTRHEAAGPVFTLDNGDTFHGTYAAVKTKGEALVPAMNALQIDAMTGHWEFAYGPAGFKALTEKLNYPMLAINVIDEASGELFFSPYRLIERDGIRLGVIGIACNIVDKTMPPSFSEGVRFTLGKDELPGWIDHVRNNEKADVVVVLSHLGFPQDVQLAVDVAGIDVIVSGHTHNRMEAPVIENGTIIFQSGCHGSFIGRLDITVQDDKVIAHRHRLIPIDDAFAPDAAVDKLVTEAMAPHRDYLAQQVGQVAVPLHRYNMLHAPMDDLLLEAIAEAAGTDIAFSNGWRYGAPVPPGPVTMNDLWNIVPVNPPVSVVDLTGAEIRDMLEANLERTFARDSYEQMGGYVKRCRGLNVFVKIENPAGHRIDRLFVGGGKIEPERVYQVAFITEQGVPRKYGTHRHRLDIHAVEAMQRHLAKRPTTTVAGIGTVVAV
jgi:sulfur-oxidizing protein SoxB